MRNAFIGYTFQKQVTLLLLSLMDVERDIDKIAIEANIKNDFDDIIVYPESDGQQSIDDLISPNLSRGGEPKRVPNLDMEIVEKIADGLGMIFQAEKTDIAELPEEENSKPGYVTANPYTYAFIKEMRDTLKSNPTEAENVMWQHYRNKKTGHKIRRQHIIDNFISLHDKKLTH